MYKVQNVQVDGTLFERILRVANISIDEWILLWFI